MTYFQAILLGIIQGLTEFLPVSSSGHLVLGQGILGIKQSGNEFELMVHIGTLCSVLIYFRKQLFNLVLSLFDRSRTREHKIIFGLFIATLPVVVVALLFNDYIEAAFESSLVASAMLCVTGIILFIPTWLKIKTQAPAENPAPPTLRQSIIMGLGQALAILPGISRSGSTITGGLLAKVHPAMAAEFSFLMAIPAICGAAVFKLKDFNESANLDWGPYLAGTAAAFLFGLIAVYLVLATIRRGKFQYFGYYCIALGLVGLIYFSQNPA
ncbi:MAG: undecaprenyl-diphosphate phosphatase [Verrucomicrobiota bacterium]